jgi:hypothetical protein
MNKMAFLPKMSNDSFSSAFTDNTVSYFLFCSILEVPLLSMKWSERQKVYHVMIDMGYEVQNPKRNTKVH